jgi:anthranilate/para-aminobenzoate synthase component II
MILIVDNYDSFVTTSRATLKSLPAGSGKRNDEVMRRTAEAIVISQTGTPQSECRRYESFPPFPILGAGWALMYR